MDGSLPAARKVYNKNPVIFEQTEIYIYIYICMYVYICICVFISAVK